MEKQVGEERNRQKRQSEAVKEEGKEQNLPAHSLFAGQKSIELNICQRSLSVPTPDPPSPAHIPPRPRSLYRLFGSSQKSLSFAFNP